MKTIILSEKDLDRAVSLLKNGVPVAFPTETVYGLGASIFDCEAIKKVFRIKGRPSDNPLIVHVSDLNQVESLAKNLPPLFFSLTKKYWPGPLTLVVEKKLEVPSIVSGGLSSVAIRMPSNPTALKLIERVGPLVAPSANLSGRPSPTSCKDVLEDLDGKISAIIDGGRCPIGIESTVLSLIEDVPTLLRPGVIQFDAPSPNSGTKIASPGMKYRHYAPNAKVTLVEEIEGVKDSFILSTRPTEGVRLLNEFTLYHELRNADRAGITEILIHCSTELRENKALMNRILKASAKKT